MLGKRLTLILLAIVGLCCILATGGGGAGSGGDQTGAGTTVADATPKGMNSCLVCHSPISTLVVDYLTSRHGNHMLAAGKTANDAEVPSADPSPSSCNYECHDPYNDGANIDGAAMQTAVNTLAAVPGNFDWTTAASIVGCEGCHGGGQFHSGIGPIPYPVPGPAQCGLCHYVNDALAKASGGENLYGSVPRHTTSSSGNNVRRNITDSHIDDPATGYGLATNVVEGYVIRTSQQNGCVDCHFGGHEFDLAKNYEWAESGHAGEIKTIKDAALAAGLAAAVDDATRLQLLADVTAAGPDDTAVFPHYDWDADNRASCQECHTSTGFSNFLDNGTNYNSANNDFSHLSGWVKGVSSSGQNELLYCWACHSDSKGTIRATSAITLAFTYNSAAVTLPDVNDSNVCVKCHGGRGNNDSIRTGTRSSRFAGHHAPSAGSVFASTTHTGYEFTGQSYANAAYEHVDIDNPTNSGPCASCHMGATQNHTFSAVVYTSGKITRQDTSDPIATIRNLATCNVAGCHDGAGGNPAVMSAAALQALKVGFEAAVTVLTDLVENTTVNYLNQDISADYATVALDAYGAFQNKIYMEDEPCGYVHNGRYFKRLIYDSIDWLDNGALNGTINLTGSAAAAAYLNGADPIGAVTRP